MNSFSISYDFAEKYVRFSKPEYIQAYVYIKYYMSKNNIFPSCEEIGRGLGISAEHASFILDFWISRGEILCENGEYFFSEEEKKESKIPVRRAPEKRRATRPSYSMAEIDAASKDKTISGLFYQAETVLHKVLSQTDMEMIYSFVDWLGLPAEVITMLLSYAAKRGKTGRRYLETVAIDWADRGIDTFEAAEEYVRELEEKDSNERKIRKILGIYDRALTATEKKYIEIWSREEYSLDLIPLAYDRTVSNTGKLSWNYMNKILTSWAEAGYRLQKDVERAEAENAGKRTPAGSRGKQPKSRFNNYEDTNKVDYGKLEEQILDMMLDD